MIIEHRSQPQVANCREKKGILRGIISNSYTIRQADHEEDVAISCKTNVNKYFRYSDTLLPTTA